MSIESKIPVEELNIKDLSLETPEGSGVEFKLSGADEQRILKSFNGIVEGSILNIYRSTALNIERLGLRDKVTIFPSFEDHERKYLLGEARNPARFNNNELAMWQNYTKKLADFKRLFPAKVSAEMLDFPWEQVRDSLQKSTSNNFSTINLNLELAANLKILQPKKIDRSIISPKVIESLYFTLRNSGQFAKEDDLCAIYANLKILGIPIPEDLKINKGIFKYLEEEIAERRKNQGTKDSFEGLLAKVRIVYANKVTVDETGVRVFDKPLMENTAGLPEIKKF